MNADALELYMLGLINEERTSRGLHALQLETNLNASAEDHSEWMLATNTFSHAGALIGNVSSTATQRIDAEFDLSGSWRTAENIAVQSARGDAGFFDDVANLHVGLMNSPGHRANLLNPDLDYIGIGVEIGDFEFSEGEPWPSVIVTQNFASTQGTVDLDPGASGGPSEPGPEFTETDDDIELQEAGVYFALGGDDNVVGSEFSETINGGSGNDEIFGNAGNDLINGDENNDRLFDGLGNDTVYGGSGNDYVRVGGGEESFDGGSGTDYISYYDSTGGITANLEEDTVSGSWAVNDTIKDFESISGSKTGGDHITGTSGANVIKTYGGNDRVYAGKGSDRVELGDGNDYVRVGGGEESFDGGSGTDYISYYDSTGGIMIDLAADTVSGSWAVNDTIKNFESASGSGTGNDQMYGTSGANTLKGFGGDDLISGRAGDDQLYGGAGDDQLFGGAGADEFHIRHGEGHDTIEDFENNLDVIQLDDFNFNSAQDAFAFANQVGNNVVFDFGSGDGLTVIDTTLAQLNDDLILV